MVKAKSEGKTGGLSKLPLKSVKQSAILKKGKPKFGNTPTGKVNLINNSNMQNIHSMKPQKQFPKGKSVSTEKSSQQQGKQKGSSNAKNFNNKKNQSLQTTNGKTNIVKGMVPIDEESDSDKDDNEGINIRKGISMVDEDENDKDSEDTNDEESEDSENEDEDDSDEEEEEEEEVSGPGLKDLFGKSLADDDEDEDFDGAEEDSEDEDISDEEDDSGAKNSEKKAKQQDNSQFEQEKHNEKTIFVGNLPVSTKKEQLGKLFKQFGPVQAVRLRGIVPMEEKIPKKVAAITKKIHPKIKTIYAYVVFQKEESAKAALVLNGKLFEGNYLRVDGTMKSLETSVNPKKSVFLGNLSFKADNNAVWEHFKDCGGIESVRIIKHNSTGVGKGIGYINFKHEDSVALALKLDGTQLLNREVRVKPYTAYNSNSKKPKHEGKKRPLPQGSSSKPKKMKASPENLVQHNKKSQKKKGPVSEGKQITPQNKGAFQGQKVDAKKKKKPNKLAKQKKIMAAKLAYKSKKPAH